MNEKKILERGNLRVTADRSTNEVIVETINTTYEYRSALSATLRNKTMRSMNRLKGYSIYGQDLEWLKSDEVSELVEWVEEPMQLFDVETTFKIKAKTQVMARSKLDAAGIASEREIDEWSTDKPKIMLTMSSIKAK